MKTGAVKSSYPVKPVTNRKIVDYTEWYRNNSPQFLPSSSPKFYFSTTYYLFDIHHNPSFRYISFRHLHHNPISQPSIIFLIVTTIHSSDIILSVILTTIPFLSHYYLAGILHIILQIYVLP